MCSDLGLISVVGDYIRTLGYLIIETIKTSDIV